MDILPGFAVDRPFYNEDGSVGGVITSDMGISKDGERKDTFQPGTIVKAAQTIFSEGCRGSNSQKLIKNFNLTKNTLIPQSYGLGLKEVWEVDNKHFEPGLIMHTVSWPLDIKTYGGSFLYHMNENQVHVGFVVGLDYKNPYLNPYQEF